MTKEQEIKLAKYLRELAEKLSREDEDWDNWVAGSLIGMAEMLEITNEEKTD